MRFFIDTLSLRKRQQVIDTWNDVNGEYHIYDYSPVRHDINKVAIQCNVSQSDVCEVIAWYSYCSQFYEYYDIFHPEEIEDWK